MKYLLDTIVWLWSVGPAQTIGTAGLEILASAQTNSSLRGQFVGSRDQDQAGKFQLPELRSLCSQAMAEQGIRSLPINQDHSLRVYDLPLHHSDPFDRLIIAQAMVEEMTVLTSDRIFEKYPIDVIWCGR